MKHFFSRAIFVMATLLTTLATWAQDIIITTDAQKIEAKILEVSKSEIRYKEKDNLDGPTFVLGTDEINSIIYSNGKVVFYNQQSAEKPKQEKPVEAVLPAREPAAQPIPSAPTVDESMAEILFLSGNMVTAQITALKGDHVAYIQDGKEYVIPASQVQKVTFLQNGQVKEYNGQSTVTVQQNTAKQESNNVAVEKQAPEEEIVYTWAEYKGDYLPKFAYKKVNVPGKKYKKWRYVGGNMVLTEKEFLQIVEQYCPEAYEYYRKWRTFFILECVSIFVGLIPVVIFAIVASNKASKILPTYNNSCAGKQVAVIEINPQDYFKDHVQLSRINFDEQSVE